MRIFKFDIVRNLLENQKRPENKYLGKIIIIYIHKWRFAKYPKF